MSEELLIRHCSPTLAGIKTGNMFNCSFDSKDEMRVALRYFNKKLSKKGIRLLPLRYAEGKALIYVYRPAHLLRDFKDGIAVRILRERGYFAETPERCIMHLVKRLGECDEFPHEIGLFLGYPPNDVRGFIENKDDCKLVGAWKVYSDEDAARKTFEKYNKCTAAYCKHYASGSSIERLTVAV